MRIEAAIFDIGNVLVRFDWQLAERQFRSRIGNDTKEARDRFLVLKERFELGQVSQEAFLREAIRIIDFRGGSDEFTTIWNGIFSSNGVMEEFIIRLRNSLPLYLLSNTSELHLAYLRERFQVLRHFADGVYSCRVECAKPDHKIFAIAAKQFGVTPSRTIYVDDLAANIESAADFGFHAIQYEWKKHSEFQKKLASIFPNAALTSGQCR
jgi:putative hydrolase of the HAD superfamily